MEYTQYDKDIALDILNRVFVSIGHVEERSLPYHCGDDFLMSSTGVAILDSICMQFIAIGESLKVIALRRRSVAVLIINFSDYANTPVLYS